MANTILTADLLIREALRVLHQKLNFVGNVVRSYDGSFAADGWKAGDTLRIALPAQFTVRSGATLAAQDFKETNTTIQRATQKGVDVNFTTKELTLDLNSFSKRLLEPALSVLAAVIEADALSMTLDVANIVDDDAAALSFLTVMKGRRTLNESLAPMDNQRTGLLSPFHNVKFIDAVKGLFHSSEQIASQYREGMVGKIGGFNFFENTLVADHTTGTAAKTTGYLSNGATQSGASIIVDTGSTTFLKGDIITFAGVNEIHPESKADLGFLKTFVITANSGASATSLAISPTLVATATADQNASTTVADGSAVVKVGAGASELLNGSMLFHKEAFAFATADLIMPNGLDFSARRTVDGIAMRIVRQYDIVNDKMPTRIDVLYGFKTIRPELAVRIHADA